jgi:hypothetical protein
MTIQEMARQAKLELTLLRTMIRQEREHAEICKTVMRLLDGRDSMSQAESEKFEGFLDVLKLLETQQFNEAMAKAKARGLVIH